MIMRFAWVSWNPPASDPQSEFQIAQTISSVGKAPLIWLFCGIPSAELPDRKASFFATHAAGLFYFALILIGMFNLDQDQKPHVRDSIYPNFESYSAPKRGSRVSAVELLSAWGWIGGGIFYGSMVIAAVKYSSWLTTVEGKFHLPRRQNPTSANSHAEDSEFYKIVADEIDNGQLDRVSWTRAVANSGGDPLLAKSLYIRCRVQLLNDARAEQERAAQCAREAEILRAEQAKHQQRQAREAAASNESGPFGLVAAFTFCAFAIVFMVVQLGALTRDERERSTASTLHATPTSTPAPKEKPTAVPSGIDETVQLERVFIELEKEYQALLARRASLTLSNPEEVHAFNRAAADYTRKVQEARDRRQILKRAGPSHEGE